MTNAIDNHEWFPFRETSLDRTLAPEHADLRDCIVRALERVRRESECELDALGRVKDIVPLDGVRSNKVLLIDGGRGSGKTTLLLHTVTALRERLDSVVPVALIDLDTLPSATSILVQLIVQLFQFSLKIESRGEELSEAWHHLATVIGTSWPGNLESRSSHLDPIDYALELEDGARRRLDLGARFRHFMTLLTEAWEADRRTKERPLFVIAIDDADMQPTHLHSLGHALRLLWHPSLAFLLTGDTELFRHGLRNAYRTHLQTAVTSEDRRIESETLACKIADEVLDKTIPITHRFGIEDRTTKQRLEALRLGLKQRKIHPLAEMALAYQGVAGCLPPRFRELAQVVEQVCHRSGDVVSLSELGAVLWQSAASRDASIPHLVRFKPPESWLFEARYMLEFATHIAFSTDLYGVDLSAPVLLGREGHRVLDYGAEGADTRVVLALGLLLMGSELANDPSALTVSRRSSFPGVLCAAVHPEFRANEGVEQYINWASGARATIRSMMIFYSYCRGSATGDIAEAAHLFLLSLCVSKDFETDVTAVEAIASQSKEEVLRHLRDAWTDDYELASATALLCAPESGLSSLDANELLGVMVNELGEKPVEVLQKLLTRRRRVRAGQSLASSGQTSDVEAWLRRVDVSMAGRAYDYVRFFDKRAPEVSVDMASVPASKMKIVERLKKGLPSDVLGLLPSLASFDRKNGGLALYLTDQRARELAIEADEEELSRVAEATVSVPRGRGTLPFQLQHLWMAAGNPRARPGAGGFLMRFRTDGRVILTVQGVEAPQVRADEVFAGLRLTGRRTEIAVRSLRWDWVEPLSSLTPTQRLVWMMAWDYSCDRGWIVQRSREAGGEWPGVVITHPAVGISIGWPVPQWPALYDEERLVNAWERVGREAKELSVLLMDQVLSEDDVDAASRIADALAFWYVKAVRSIAVSRDGYVPMDMRSPDDFSSDIAGLLIHGGVWDGDDDDPRANQVRQFIMYDIPLLSAPESGMSSSGARALWSAWLAAMKRTSKVVDFSVLRRRRAERIGSAVGGDPSKAIEQLNAIYDFESWVSEAERYERGVS